MHEIGKESRLKAEIISTHGEKENPPVEAENERLKRLAISDRQLSITDERIAYVE